MEIKSSSEDIDVDMKEGIFDSNDEIDPINDIIDYLVHKEEICFKSQQREESDLTISEKKLLAINIYKKGKIYFLERFGKYLKLEHLNYFDEMNNTNFSDSELLYYVKNLRIFLENENKRNTVKNRRFEALSDLVQRSNYFSEVEMMKRNPLLYEHLIGQYLTENEKKTRDNVDSENETFLNALLESIERYHIKNKLDEQQIIENGQYSENLNEENSEDSDNESYKNVCWGEFTNYKKKIKKVKDKIPFITAPERDLLREEFVQEMYRSFLEGEDKNFDYLTVDENSKYDCLDTYTRDQEDKYFDSESPEEISEDIKNDIIDESLNRVLVQHESEDELDVYMKHLNRHPSLCTKEEK